MINPMYPKDGKLWEKQKELIRNSKGVTEKNKKHILNFLESCEKRNISKLRLVFYSYRLRKVAEIMGNVDFKKAKREDFERVMKFIYDQEYKKQNIDSYIVSIKAFMRWLYNRDKSEPTPKCVSWIERPKITSELKPENLLTEDEVQKMIKVCNDPMHQALLAVLYESGLRPEEIRNMQIKNVYINDTSIKVYTKGKMEKLQGERTVFLVRSYKLFKTWLDIHERKRGDESWVWSVDGGKIPISDSFLRKIVSRTAKKAKIKKRVWPYLFRHTRATYLYKTLPAAVARRMLGHVTERMEKIYAHLGSSDIEKATLELYGIKKEENAKEGICLKCGNIIQIGDDVCEKCGLAQDTKAALEKEIEKETLNSIMNMLLDDPIIKERISQLKHQIKSRLGVV